MSSRDLFAASRDLLVNIKDFLVICDPTKVISINNHHIHPINSPHGEEVMDFWTFGLLLICSLGLFSPHSISSLVCSGAKPQQLAPTVLGTSFF